MIEVVKIIFLVVSLSFLLLSICLFLASLWKDIFVRKNLNEQACLVFKSMIPSFLIPSQHLNDLGKGGKRISEIYIIVSELSVLASLVIMFFGLDFVEYFYNIVLD